MAFNWFKRKRKTPEKTLVIFGTEFGSYQFLQLVQLSRKYQAVGFISTDPWQKRSGFGKIGVILPAELNSICEAQNVVAIVVTSDQKEFFEKGEEMQPVRDCKHLVKHCEILEIPQESSMDTADAFIDNLV